MKPAESGCESEKVCATSIIKFANPKLIGGCPAKRGKLAAGYSTAPTDPDEVDREATADIPFNYPVTRVEWEHDMVVRHLRRAGIN